MVKRYDVKGKTYFKYPNKYYYADTGLRNARLNYRQYDLGHIMENIIYNELLRLLMSEWLLTVPAVEMCKKKSIL